MSLIQMSVTAGILILGIVLFRSLLIHRLPKKVMVLLWEIAILRLLVSLAIPLPPAVPTLWADAGSLVINNKAYHVTIATYDGHFGEMQTSEIANISFDKAEGMDAGTIVRTIYLLGTAAMLLGSVFLYVRDSRLFREGLPMPEQEKERLILLAAKEEKDKKQLRDIRFQISDRTATPVTYGVIHPAIVFPKGFSLKEDEEMSFCLRHEWVHIKHRDNLKKLIAHLALCIHWFNPLVWVMYLLFNRDMELLCDETVVRHSGGERRDYAMALLTMASCRNLGFGTGLGFGKNAVKERIVAVMTFKKTTPAGVLAAVFAVSMALTAFFVTNSEVYAMRSAVFDVSETDSGKINVAFAEGTTVNVAEDMPSSLQEQEYAADAIQAVTVIQDYGTAEYTTNAQDVIEQANEREGIEYAVSASSEAVTVEESAYLTDSTRQFIERLVDEFGIYGLSAEISDSDYQLYYEGEPIYFLADNEAEIGFSGRVASQSADGAYGDTGVVTDRNEEGEIVGLIHLSPRESRAYSELWW